jgi:rod shape-determining protein MreB
MALFSKVLGIDVGTVYTRIAEGNQVVLQEPTVVAVDIEEQKMVEVGQDALNLMGRTGETIEAYYEYTHVYLSEMIKRVTGTMRLIKPQVVLTYPYGITSVERRALHEATLEALGPRSSVLLMPDPLTAALGIDLPIGTPSGNMVVCMGGGCTQAAVLSMHDIVSGQTLREGGLHLDEAISSYIRRKFGLIIGLRSAEQIKIKIGAAVPQDEEMSMELQGQDQVTGLPRPLTLTTSEVIEAVEDPLDNVFEMIRQVLEKTPPELASDIIDRGIALAGGGALLRGIDRLMTQKLGVPTYLVDNPATCVVEGAVRGLEMYPILQRNLPKF